MNELKKMYEHNIQFWTAEADSWADNLRFARRVGMNDNIRICEAQRTYCRKEAAYWRRKLKKLMEA